VVPIVALITLVAIGGGAVHHSRMSGPPTHLELGLIAVDARGKAPCLTFLDNHVSKGGRLEQSGASACIWQRVRIFIVLPRVR